MVTAQVEDLLENLEALKRFFSSHWEELALDKDLYPLSPQYRIYEARAKAGETMLVTLRSDGEIVGYFVGFVAPGLHYSTCLTLTMDIFWVHPGHRNGMAGVRLFREVEREAARRGVNRMFMGSKLHADSGALFKRLGYRPVETYYSKTL